MNLLTRIFAFAVSLTILLFSTNVIAAPSPVLALTIREKFPITNGEFTVDTLKKGISGQVPQKLTVTSAVLSLPAGETGTIDKITITGPDGLEFGCEDIKVKDKVDLIEACGGLGVLKPGGPIDYVATGSGFSPKLDTELGVTLTTEP